MLLDRRVDGLRPVQRVLQLRVAGPLHFFFQRRIAQLRLPLHPIEQRWGNIDLDAPRLDLGTLVGPLQRLDQRRKTVDPPALRIQVDELGGLAGVLAHALQAPIVDRVGNEAFLVLQLHRVERATVRIDAYQIVVLGRELDHHFLSA